MQVGAKHTEEAKARMGQRGSGHHCWKGGRRICNRTGYVILWLGKDHQMADSAGRCFEHRLVMSEMIGRPLSRTEVVHHVNSDRTDNRPENLVLFKTTREHSEYHAAELRNELAQLTHLREENARLKELLGRSSLTE